jgi:regulator of nucleoside diphosphate kinase
MSSTGEIRLTRLDVTRLGQLDGGRTLISLLNTAHIVASEAIPPDVVTMNSKMILEDRASGNRIEASVVYPIDADPAQGKLSVFSAVGRRLLGMRVGDEVKLPVPYAGALRIKLVEILYQPEAAGHLSI